ncbi:CbiQ family ECF transporter T component [Thermovenabulum sp.]|uniref:CbiQ family ECF transporter T component n=2 Tax=Thermovenabulum sp. TaxID=3100335 RepID=UPI003C7D5521
MIKEVILYSTSSRGRLVNPLEKLIFVLTAVISSNYFNAPLPFAINFTVFLFLHLYFKTPFNKVMKLLCEIAGFYFASSLVFLADKNIKGFLIANAKGVVNSSALTFLIFTTPVDDFLYLMSRTIFLKEIADLAKTMECFILLLEDELSLMILSAKARGGFDGFLNGIRSCAKIAALLLIDVLKRWKSIDEAISSRCFSGKIPYSKREFNRSGKRIILICLFAILEVILAVKF